MRELRFHQGLYSGRAVDETIKAFAGHADVLQSLDGEHFVVRLTAKRAAAERAVAGAFANYALGLTVDRGGRDDEENPGGGNP